MSSRPPLVINPPALSVLPDLPPVSALFLIEFDVKAGYTITWKQAESGLELEGVVEYKSLPSGLHTVSEDLIYFIHDGGYAGLSAFVNAPTDDEGARHARMIAVGVLVPLSYGRLGRSWRHAEGLKEMAGKLAVDPKETGVLEKYWSINKAPDARNMIDPLRDSPLSSPSITFQAGVAKGHSRKRSASDGNALINPGHRLSPFHPAWSLTSLLDTFGPLIFSIHRAALLRKRILLSTHAPVHEACDYVYDISILSNIPLSVFELLDQTAPAQRLRPLFNIGVHDIPFLIEDQVATNTRARKLRNSTSASSAVEPGGIDDANSASAGSGWVACTTDSILAMKNDLWDVLITMPPPHAPAAKERVWPTVELTGGVPLRATQRDLRRFRNLRAGLARLASQQHDKRPETPRSHARPGTSSGWSVGGQQPQHGDDALLVDAAENVVEPTTWAALAYSGFMWWASAGEQRRSEEVEEAASDASLLADLSGRPMESPQRRGSSGGGVSRPLGESRRSGVMADSVLSLPSGNSGGSRAVGGAGDAPPLDQQQEEADDPSDDEQRARVELAIIAYFRRLTTQIIAVLADIVESGDDEDTEDDDVDLTTASAGVSERLESASLVQSGEGSEGGSEGDDGLSGSVHIDSDAITRMGLDVWSNADVEFVREMTAQYFSRRARVESKGVEVCGLRVC